VIHGSAIPRGAELSIGYRQNPQDREISFKLIKDGAPLTCSTSQQPAARIAPTGTPIRT
jgi:hypothetical protein